MKVKAACWPNLLPRCGLIELEDGSRYTFRLTPYRKICEADLNPVPGYDGLRSIYITGSKMANWEMRIYGLELV